MTQLALPCCSKCGALHVGAGWCQACTDNMTVGWLIAYAVYNDEPMDNQQGLEYAKVQRPELFERGVLPGRWLDLARADAQRQPPITSHRNTGQSLTRAGIGRPSSITNRLENCRCAMQTRLYKTVFGVETGDIVTTSYNSGPYEVIDLTPPRYVVSDWQSLSINRFHLHHCVRQPSGQQKHPDLSGQPCGLAQWGKLR